MDLPDWLPEFPECPYGRYSEFSATHEWIPRGFGWNSNGHHTYMMTMKGMDFWDGPEFGDPGGREDVFYLEYVIKS